MAIPESPLKLNSDFDIDDMDYGVYMLFTGHAEGLEEWIDFLLKYSEWDKEEIYRIKLSETGEIAKMLNENFEVQTVPPVN